MDFIELKVKCAPDFAEILMAELSEMGFNSFVEVENGFDAYIDEDDYSEDALQEIYERYKALTQFSYDLNKIQKRNWNEEWEKNYEPIIVEDYCIVRASFHTISKNYPIEIIINPKMSFGTGHHATTWLMLKQQIDLDLDQKIILDAGCGTGILGIFSSLKGAKEVHACDIDEWPVENSIENIALNSLSNIKVYLGTVKEIPKPLKYDVILANINRNVLLSEISLYASLQLSKGILLLSGFYDDDVADIEQECNRWGYKKTNTLIKDKWASCRFEMI